MQAEIIPPVPGAETLGARIERDIQYWPDEIGAHPRTIVQRGTVVGLIRCSNGATLLRVAWDGDTLVFCTGPERVRPVDPEHVAAERTRHCFAIGDAAERNHFGAILAGTVLEARRSPLDGWQVRAYWPELDREQWHRAADLYAPGEAARVAEYARHRRAGKRHAVASALAGLTGRSARD